MVAKGADSCVWAQIPGLLLICYVNLGKFIKFPMSCFLFWKMKNVMEATPGLLRNQNEVIYNEDLEKLLLFPLISVKFNFLKEFSIPSN